MKALIQRVLNAKVTVNGEVISSIEQGLCILIGICNSDTVKDMEYIAKKILKVRLFNDENNKTWQKSVVDKQYEILCVSQFTLYNTWKGNKPDFHLAMPSEKSKEFYDKFIEMLKKEYTADKIKDGQFGAFMQVSIQNDGPVTLEITSPEHLGKVKANNRQSNVVQNDEESKQQEPPQPIVIPEKVKRLTASFEVPLTALTEAEREVAAHCILNYLKNLISSRPQ